MYLCLHKTTSSDILHLHFFKEISSYANFALKIHITAHIFREAKKKNQNHCTGTIVALTNILLMFSSLLPVYLYC